MYRGTLFGRLGVKRNVIWEIKRTEERYLRNKT